MGVGANRPAGVLVTLPQEDESGDYVGRASAVVAVEGEGDGVLGLMPSGQAILGTLTDGQAIVVQALGRSVLTVIAEAGATATVSRVDAIDASAHTTGSHNQFEVAATNRTATNVDWAFYRISSSGGTVRWALT